MGPANRVYLFVWGAFGTSDGRFVSATGQRWARLVRGESPAEYANTPAVVYDADHGVFMVVWQDNRVNSQIPVLYGRALSYQQSGAPALGPPTSGSPNCQFHVAAVVAYSTGSDEFLALSYQAGANDIRGVRFTVDGALSGALSP